MKPPTSDETEYYRLMLIYDSLRAIAYDLSIEANAAEAMDYDSAATLWALNDRTIRTAADLLEYARGRTE